MSDDNRYIDQIIRLKTAGQQYIDGEISYHAFEDILKEPSSDPDRGAKVAALVEAARRIEPNIGWRSMNGEDKDKFYCEFCGESHLDWGKIQHHDECAVFVFRAALQALEGEGK